MSAALMAPAEQIPDIVGNPQIPVLAVAIYPIGEKVSPAKFGSQLPPPPTASAAVTSWEAGRMRIAIEGQDTRPLYLVVAENFYKDWHATVDGVAVPVLRAQNTLLSVTVPPGAKDVAFDFRSPEYERGRLVTLLSLVIVAGLFAVPMVRRRRPADA